MPSRQACLYYFPSDRAQSWEFWLLSTLRVSRKAHAHTRSPKHAYLLEHVLESQFGTQHRILERSRAWI